MTTVLTVSKDLKTLNDLQEIITGDGYAFLSVTGFDQLAKMVAQHEPEILVLDVETLGMSGAMLCDRVRSDFRTRGIPLLLLTGIIDAHEAAGLLDSGADDLLRKPFADRELSARLRALLRWTKMSSFNHTVNLRLVEPQNVVYVDQRRVSLTPMEFQLLHFLCNNRTRYFSADDLLNHLWNYPPEMGDTALVRNHIRNLRRKLEFDPDRPRVLVSRYGQGYSIHAVIQQS